MNRADPNKFPLFETIRIENGLIQNAIFHLNRMRQACLEEFGQFTFENIFDAVQIPENGKYRLNIWYNRSDCSMQISLYVPAVIKKVAVVNCPPGFDYSRKRTDRTVLNEMLKSASGSDEIVIVKDGFVTDTSKANIVFEKDGELFTPDTYLLNGTMRQYLLKSGKIIEKAIREKDMADYDRVYFINAMNPLETAPVLNCREKSQWFRC